MFCLILKAQTANINVQIDVTMLLISTYFLQGKKGFFPRDLWNKTNQTISDFMELLKNKVIDPNAAPVKASEDGGDIDQFLKSSDQQIYPAIVNFIEKLDQQLYKAFQSLTQTNMEYLYRLKDECQLIKQCDNVIAYFTDNKDWEKVARIQLIKLEHIYYKQDSLYARTQEKLKGKPEKLAELYFLENSEQEIEKIVQNVIK